MYGIIMFIRRGLMSKEKIEYQVVTVRIPKKMYADYKEVLLQEGKIVTYDLRNYMHETIQKFKQQEREK